MQGGWTNYETIWGQSYYFLGKISSTLCYATEKLMKKAVIQTNYSVPLLVQFCLSLLHLATAIGMVQVGLDAIVLLLLINENKASAVT